MIEIKEPLGFMTVGQEKKKRKKGKLKILYSVCALDNSTDQTADCE